MRVITGYGDGVTGYLGAGAGNGYGKCQLIRATHAPRKIKILPVRLFELQKGNAERNLKPENQNFHE